MMKNGDESNKIDSENGDKVKKRFNPNICFTTLNCIQKYFRVVKQA